MGQIPLSAIAAGVQLGKAGIDAYRAHQFGKAKRPLYSVPDAINKNTALANNAYGASTLYGLPGQGRIENKLNAQTAGTANQIQQSQQSPSAILAGLAALDQNSKNSMADVGLQAAKYRAGQMNTTRGQLINANNTLAHYQDKAWDWNQKSPYMASMAAASALRGSAQQNLWNGVQSGIGALGQMGSKTGSWGNPQAPVNSTGPTSSNPFSAAQMYLASKRNYTPQTYNPEVFNAPTQDPSFDNYDYNPNGN